MPNVKSTTTKTSSQKRDDFSARVARTLAERAGFICSNPNCRRPTIGPSPANPTLSIYSGEAAHITAAAEGGPRFDKTLTKEQRSSWDNGIHLCASCADIIDKNNGTGFSTALLREWKANREGEASATHGTGAVTSSDSVDYSYQPDFRILRDQTRLALGTLANFGEIAIPNGIFKINRAVDGALYEASQEDSVLVVGEPGAGKSGATFRAIERLFEEGNDVVALPVEEFAALSRGQLRDELGLAHDLLDVLCHWPGDKPAYLCVDALDAARDADAAKALRQMITAVHKHAPRWHVIASIRKYDLRHSDELRRDFRGEPIQPFVDAEFVSVRHVNVPKLTDAELTDAVSQAGLLRPLIESGDDATRTLLRNVFNLRLATELLLDGVPIQELTPIHTQSELLERYWDRRVTQPDGDGDARQLVLDRAVRAMIDSRSLQVERKRVLADDVRSSQPLNDLLHEHVLVEWQRSPSSRAQSALLVFPHHIIFDYAVARLLRGHPTTLIAHLANDPQFVLALRPSVVLHYHYLWSLDTADRATFWETVNAVSGAADVPTIGKLIGPSVAADLIHIPTDYAVLLDVLASASTKEERSAPEIAIQQLRGAVMARNDWRTGADKAIWCQFVRDTALKGEAASENILRALVTVISELGRLFTTITPDGQYALGEAARILLRSAWKIQPYDSWFVMHGIDVVCRTYSSEPIVSSELLRPIIEPLRLAEFGYIELPRLADYVGQIAEISPDFATDIYVAAYSYNEESQEKTVMNGSLILSLSSNRRQDYEMAFYHLQEEYPKFLQAAPVQATRALIQVLQALADTESVQSGDTAVRPDEPFDWNGTQAFVRSDTSCVWAEGGAASHYEPIQMLNHWVSHFENQWSAPGNQQMLNAVLDILVAENRCAILWARVLKSAAIHPDRVGRSILPLLSATPILWSLDTRYNAGEALRVLYPSLSEAERLQIEEAILAIPDYLPEELLSNGERRRDVLLGCLERDLIVSSSSREIVAKFDAAGEALPKNLRVFTMGKSEWSSYTSQEWLQEEGVDTTQTENRLLQSLATQTEEFAHKNDCWRNGPPDDEAVTEIVPVLLSLHQALSAESASILPDAMRIYGWDSLADACQEIARRNNPDVPVGTASLLQQAFVGAMQQPEPRPDVARDKQFESSQSWGVPSPRITAAQGLMLLGWHGEYADATLLTQIEQLANDPVAAVRFQVIAHINLLAATAPDLMWSLLEASCANETNRGVLRGTLNSLSWLANIDASRVADQGIVLFARLSEDEQTDGIRSELAALMTRLYVLQMSEIAQSLIFQLIAEPIRYHKENRAIISHLRGVLAYGSADTPLPAKEEVRKRGISLFKNAVERVIGTISQLYAEHVNIPFAEWSETEQKTIQEMHDLLDHAAYQVYFGSGAYDRGRGSDKTEDETKEKIGSTERSRFLIEMESILELLAETGNPRVAYRLMETLEQFVEVNPRRVLHLIGAAIKAATTGGGLQFESLASASFVRCIEQYLMEHRNVLQEPDTERLLVTTLDAFVQAGWSDAIRLAYRLDEISQ